MSDVRIRPSTAADLSEIQAIYAHHVLHGLASFEEEPPTATTLAQRRAEILERHLPYLVADRGGEIVGYAYAGPYRTRSAYRFAVENSVYVKPGLQRGGIGAKLLTRLIADCESLGLRQMVAVIGDSANHPSIGLHAALGFRQIGILEAVGFKFGRWVDSVLMQRALGPGGTALPPAL